MVTNITAIPAAIVTIVKSAFTGSALAGGAMTKLEVGYSGDAYHALGGSAHILMTKAG